MTTAIRTEGTTSIVQWESVVLDLDNEEFHTGFLRGRSYYFEDTTARNQHALSD